MQKIRDDIEYFAPAIAPILCGEFSEAIVIVRKPDGVVDTIVSGDPLQLIYLSECLIHDIVEGKIS